ncbi:MAG: translation initiation factor IF-2 [Saprospiraceae bacterium]|nr:translation initiation factor IF-2 [Saprospiraceae bacterium]
MSDKPVRLAVAAKKFNLGTASIVEHLQDKGYEVENKPTTKLSPEMMAVLMRDFKADIALKEKAEQIHIGEARRNAAPKEAEVAPEPEAKPAPPKEETPKPEPKKQAAPKPAPKAEPKKVKVEAKKLEGPKVVDKIDLAEQKPAKPKPAPKKEAPKEQEAPAAKKPAAKKPTTEPKPKEVVAEEDQKIQTRLEKLEGPKILGKIELPVEKPKKKEESAPQGDKKRKRKRIVKKVDVSGRGGNNRGNRDNRGPNRNKGRGRQVEEKEAVSEQEIQDKIKATMARMSGGDKNKGKGDRAKYKRAKRKEHAAAREEAELAEQLDNKLVVSEYISLSELASLMDVAPADLVSASFSLGMIVTINQRLDAELIQILGEEYGYEIEFASITEQVDDIEEEEDDPSDLEERNPIVTVMGHVDHGKTSLLDYIRDANVIAGEAGGITQHIGAYEVQLKNGKKITFLDTPGHEAFTAMRARGAKVTDLAIIVIAADDSVMPQTREAISHAQAGSVPMIFAFNKMDKDGANSDKIREELSQMNILVEDWGGEFQAQEISAKHGTNIDELLDKVLLEAEMLELKANPDKNASGTVLEAKLDKGRGYVTSILVQEGSLQVGDFMVAGQHFGKVKAMFDERGKPKKVAGPSAPVEILGLSGAPTAGELFKIYNDESAAKSIANKREQIMREQGLKARKHITLDEIGRRLALGNFKELNIVLKGDVDGSVEALADSLQKLSTEEVGVNIIHKGVGQISESDVLLASASDAVVLAFQVRPSVQARQLAEKEDIEIRMYSVIYDAIEEIKSAIEGMLAPTYEERIVCNIEILQTFKVSKVGTIAGCMVLDGKIKPDTKVRLIRDGIVVYTGELASLKRYKDDVKEVFAGQECGLNIKNYNDVKVGDIIEGYDQIEIKRKLS